MKIKTIATAVILSFAAIGAAQARTPRGDTDNQPFQGTYGQDQASASRAQVLAELEQARSAGLTGNNGDIDNAPFVAQQDSGVTRAQVAAAAVDHAGSSTDIAFGDIDNQPFQGA
ncbi:hypothetical protein CAL26_16775 [Bordetella genomosp. 9]|uniref:DUF4148 domain-containing protein n=2 Tax=Bordetella TaxID=517 RepID=A0A261R3R6_9BORD|nr:MULTISPECIES: DUF4148 domain-containing protein [Bordetella]ARP82363.1 hypothetical protein CAL12_17085 [Bordetella genomosp. 8]OZI19292.1 hypothetical protein CAL26_16775 [Bordetella genomosp. 9]